MNAAKRLLIASLVIVLLDFVLVRFMAHGHVAHALLAGGPTLSAAYSPSSWLLAAALVIVRFVAVVIVPGFLATAATLASAHYFVGAGAGSRSTGTSSGGDALAEAEGTGTSIGVRGVE
jgi:hypothetical protein